MKKIIVVLLTVILVAFAGAAFASDSINVENASDIILESDGSVIIGNKYGNNEKLWIEFNQCGPNELMQIYAVYKTDISARAPEKSWILSGTDWVAPVVIKKPNASRNTEVYSGGWHKRNDGTPTAESLSVVVKIDGNVVNTPVKTKGDIVEIIVTNKLYLGATEDVSEDGLTEVIHYTIYDNKVDVSANHTVLNDLDVTYYIVGAVVRDYEMEMVSYINGDETPETGETYFTHTSGSKSEYPGVSTATHCNSEGDFMTMSIDRSHGLGNMEYVTDETPIIRSAYFGKTYISLINGTIASFAAGDTFSWKGSYAFEKKEATNKVKEAYNTFGRDKLNVSGDATLENNLVLPNATDNGCSVLWKSDNDKILSNDGVITSPLTTSSVTMTATIYDKQGAAMKKDFSFRIEGTYNFLEAKKIYNYRDNFDDNTINSAAITDISGNVTEENGALHFERLDSDGTNNVYAKIYFNEDKSAVSGKFYVEYTLIKHDPNSWLTGQVYINESYKALSVASAGKEFNLSCEDAEGNAVNKTFTASDGVTDTLNVKLYFDMPSDKFKLYLNDKFLHEGYIEFTQFDSLMSIRFLQSKGSGKETDISIDDFACYSVENGGIEEFRVDYNPFDKKISVDSPEDIFATVIAAAYKGEELVSAEIIRNVELKKDNAEIVDTSQVELGGADRVAFYIWENNNSLVPIMTVSDIRERITSN